jgi:hypothetical protein
MAESGKRPVRLVWDALVLLLFAAAVFLLGWQGVDYWFGLTNYGVEKSVPFGYLVTISKGSIGADDDTRAERSTVE